MPPKRGRRLIKKKQPEPEPEPETPTAATQQPVEQAPARGKKQTNNDEMETDQQIIQEVVNETIENLKDASDAKNTGDAEMEESSLLDQDDSENAENDAIENAKPETENTGENPAENSTAEDATTEQDEIITVSGESASQFYELSWKDQSDPEENIAKAASVAYLETQSRTNQAIFIAANVKSLNHLVKLKNNFDVETYILACKYFSFAKEYCDLVISVSDYNKSVGQIYCNSIQFLGKAQSKFKIMLQMAKKRQNKKGERYAVIPVPSMYSTRIVRKVVEYLSFGTLKIERNITEPALLNLYRCFEYFKILSAPNNEVLPILQNILTEKNFEAETFQLEKITNHCETMYSKSYYIHPNLFRKRDPTGQIIGHNKNNNNHNNNNSNSAGPTPAKKFRKNSVNSQRPPAISYVDQEIEVPTDEKIKARTAKFGEQTEDNKTLVRRSQSRFSEAGYIKETKNQNFRKSAGRFSRGRSMPRNFERGTTPALESVQAKLVARKSQQRDFGGNGPQRFNKFDNRNRSRANSRRPSAKRFDSRPIRNQTRSRNASPVYQKRRSRSRSPEYRRRRSRTPPRRRSRTPPRNNNRRSRARSVSRARSSRREISYVPNNQKSPKTQKPQNQSFQVYAANTQPYYGQGRQVQMQAMPVGYPQFGSQNNQPISYQPVTYVPVQNALTTDTRTVLRGARTSVRRF